MMPARNLAAVSDRSPESQRRPSTARVGATRRANAEDISRIERLLSLSAPGCVALPAEAIREHLECFRVGEDADGIALACLALCDRGAGVGELRSVAVDPRMRGLGIGTALVRDALARARGQFHRVRCTTQQPEFYEAFGFQKTNEPPPSLDPRTPSALPEQARVVMSIELALPTHTTALRRRSHLRLI